MRTKTSTAVTIAIAIGLLAVFVPETRAGAPLKGVDVKLGKNPGGSPAARTTGDDGKFDFGVLPKGSYYLTVALHDNAGKPPAKGGDKREAAPAPAPPSCEIEINGAEGGTIKANWDLQKGRRIYPADAAAKGTVEEKIILASDGKHPLNGTVVRPKSNISNN